MTQAPTPGPLSADDVKLLVKGDLLRVTNADGFLKANGVKDGSVVRFRSADKTWIDIQEMDFPQGSSFARFSFIGRPDADGWMPWSGGENPVPGQMVQYKLPGTNALTGPSESVDWHHQNGCGDIIAFLLAPTAPVETLGHAAAFAANIDTAPVEASGSERDGFTDALLALFFKHGFKVALEVADIDALRSAAQEGGEVQ